MPCRETWTARAVDIVVGRQQVFNKHGKPVRNTKGELVTEPASTWLLKHQRVEQMAWVPGQPALIHHRLLDGSRATGGHLPEHVLRTPYLKTEKSARNSSPN